MAFSWCDKEFENNTLNFLPYLPGARELKSLHCQWLSPPSWTSEGYDTSQQPGVYINYSHLTWLSHGIYGVSNHRQSDCFVPCEGDRWPVDIYKGTASMSWRHRLTMPLSKHLLYMHVNLSVLTHEGRVTHICVGKLTSIGSNNGLSPVRRQAIIQINAGL